LKACHLATLHYTNNSKTFCTASALLLHWASTTSTVLQIKKKLFVADALISQVNTPTMHIKSTEHNSIALFSLKPYTLAGFKPGSS
jgi:hypothetical protein